MFPPNIHMGGDFRSNTGLFGRQSPAAQTMPSMFSRSWMQPQSQGMQRPSMFGMFARPQPNFLSYLPLLMSRGMFGLGQQRQPAAVPGVGAPQQIPQTFTPQVAANPIKMETAPSSIQQAAQTFQAANPTPQLFTPTPPVQQPQVAAPAAPAWQPASWFSDPNSAARRIAAQAWGNLPLQQQQQFYADTYMGGGGSDAGNAGNDFGLGFGIDTAAGIY